MHKTQINIKKHFKKRKNYTAFGGGGVVSQLGRGTLPLPLGGGGKNITNLHV